MDELTKCYANFCKTNILNSFFFKVVEKHKPVLYWNAEDRYVRNLAKRTHKSLEEVKVALFLSEFLAEIYKSVSIKEKNAFFDLCLKGLTAYSKKDIEENPYLKNVKIKPMKKGRFSFQTVSFKRGEFFFDKLPVELNYGEVFQLGFFVEDFSCPCLMENGKTWMSISPNEINTMKDSIAEAEGNVVVLGLGLGYYPYMVHLKDSIKTVTIVEKEQDIIDLFEENILLQFDHPEKIHIVKADALDYIKNLKNVDYVFVDIWTGPLDAVQPYLEIKKIENRVDGIKFSYWIEESIISQLKGSVFVDAFVAAKFCYPIKDSEYLLVHELLGNTKIEKPKDLENLFKTKNIKKLLRNI